MDDGLTSIDDELTLEDKVAWRKKISTVDASLKSVLENHAAEKKGHFALFSHKKNADAPEEAQPQPAKYPSKRLHLGIHHATG